MVVASGLGVLAAGLRFIKPGSRGDVDLAANDRLHPTGFTGSIEIHGSEHIAMIGHRQGRHTCCRNMRDEVLNLVRPIEQRILGMRMEVDEAHKGPLLPLNRRRRLAGDVVDHP